MLDKNTTFSVSVILPNYNGRHLLERNLPSIIEAVGQYEHEIIVVDDNSSDNSCHFLENSYPDIILIRSEVNQGFSTTCNKGIKAATKELASIVNTDVTFTVNYFTNAFPHFVIDDVFAVKGEIVNYRDSFDDVINIEKTSLLYYKRGFLRFNQRIQPDDQPLSPAINSQFVLLGCCFVCRRTILLELDGYDEIYSPFYWEDADLAQRAMEHGYHLVYDSECKVYHQLSSTISNYRSNRIRRLVSNRNKFIFTWRHLKGAGNWTSHIFFMILNTLTRWITLDWKYYVAFYTALNSIISATSTRRD